MPEGEGGSGYLNIFWVATAPSRTGPFTPLALRADNPIYPGELKQPYPVVSPDLHGAVASVVRIEAAFWHLNGPLMRLGEIEVYGRPTSAPAPAPAWKLIKGTVDLPPEPLGKPEPQYDWILKQRVRGGYTGYYEFAPEWLDRCRSAGLNTLIIHMFGEGLKGDFAAELRKWGSACRERGLHFIPRPRLRIGRGLRQHPVRRLPPRQRHPMDAHALPPFRRVLGEGRGRAGADGSAHRHQGRRGRVRPRPGDVRRGQHGLSGAMLLR